MPSTMTEVSPRKQLLLDRKELQELGSDLDNRRLRRSVGPRVRQERRSID
jgi:hypothetical protein